MSRGIVRSQSDHGKSGDCHCEKAGRRGSTAAGTRGGTARGTPPGAPHSLIDASSAWAEPPLRLGRPRAREDMQGIIGSRDSAILSRCLNCRSAMSPAVIGSCQLYGIQLCNQPPRELPEHLPGPRSRRAEAVDQPILDYIASGVALWQGYERPHSREKLLPDFTISAWRGLVDLHGTKHEVVPHQRARGSGPEARLATDVGRRRVRVHSSMWDRWRRNERAFPTGTSLLKRPSPRGVGNHSLLCKLAESVSRETSLA